MLKILFFQIIILITIQNNLFTNQNLNSEIPCESFFIKESFYFRSLFYKTFKNACSIIRECYSSCNIVTTQRGCEDIFLKRFNFRCESEARFVEGCKRFVKRWVSYLEKAANNFFNKKQNQCKNVQICTKINKSLKEKTFQNNRKKRFFKNQNILKNSQNVKICLNSNGFQNPNPKKANFFRIISLKNHKKTFQIQNLTNKECLTKSENSLIFQNCDENNLNQLIFFGPGENEDFFGDYTLKINGLCLTGNGEKGVDVVFVRCDFTKNGIDWYLFDEIGYPFPVF